MSAEFQTLSFQPGSVFTPGAPVSEKELFAGRTEQVEKIVDAISQRGCHAILYGERGVGKTSLSNMISTFLAKRQAFIISRTNCDISDTYRSLWTKAFKDIDLSRRQPSVGFGPLANPQMAPSQDYSANSASPDSVRRTLEDMSKNAAVILIFDEFDRIRDPETILAMADTIKALSDHVVNVTILIIGVADSVAELIRDHQSIERALIQVPMPRMSDYEIRSIILSGFGRLGMGVDSAACEELVRFSQGVPYITHLLCIYSTRAAVAAGSRSVLPEHVDAGMNRSLDQWQQSIKSLYDEAVRSAQPSHIYREVLLACALAEVDDQRSFTAAAVKAPLSMIKSKAYETINFARHLKELSEPARGTILHRVGDRSLARYRIFNPILRPYIIMRGVREKLISKDMVASAAVRAVA